MTHSVRGFGLAATLVLVSTVAVVPQASAQSTSSTAAYVYIQIQGSQGAVYGFTASSAGQLSAIPGAPWKPAGLIVGDNKTMLVTMGEDNLHTYGIASNGAIEGQLEGNPDTDYGNDCDAGANIGAVMDHTGQWVYVLQEARGAEPCWAYKSFEISNQYSEGVLNGEGDDEVTAPPGGSFDLPSILGDESFAYADQIDGNLTSVIGFQRDGAGALQQIQFQEVDPTLADGVYVPYRPDASSTGRYLVLQLYANGSGKGQLGSYTVDSNGNISSTNTSDNMPASPFRITGTTFSYSGKMFVTYADNGAKRSLGNGIEIYNFNGADPLTPYTALLTGTRIDQVAWDGSNHLYAISASGNKLYVFTVTSTSVTEDTAWSIGAPYKMLVVTE